MAVSLLVSDAWDLPELASHFPVSELAATVPNSRLANDMIGLATLARAFLLIESTRSLVRVSCNARLELQGRDKGVR